MRIPKIQSIDRIGELSRRQKEKPMDATKQRGSKITVLVLDRLGRANPRAKSCLLPEVFASRVMIDFLSSLAVEMREHQEDSEYRYASKIKRQKATSFGMPVGLYACSSQGWMNAWAQFIIHLPRFTELVVFAEKTFEPFREFVDRYMLDQRDERLVSCADSVSLIRCLSQVSPLFLNSASKWIDLYEVLRLSIKSIFSPMTNHLGNSFHDAIFFHPDWVIFWDGQKISLFNDQLQNLINMYPSEMIISMQCREGLTHGFIQRQIFPVKGRCFYDLDLFIECRPDAEGVHYITYVRVEGAWYQCDNEKIRSISSRTLSVPLCRGILFHYKRVGI
jgi:hypothetical protein